MRMAAVTMKSASRRPSAIVTLRMVRQRLLTRGGMLPDRPRVLDGPSPERRRGLVGFGGRREGLFRVIRASAHGQKIDNLFCQPLAVACGHDDKHDCVHAQTSSRRTRAR